jgi:hypothetical protein
MTYKCVSNSKCGNPAVFGLGIKREGERERERDAIENGKEEIAEKPIFFPISAAAMKE